MNQELDPVKCKNDIEQIVVSVPYKLIERVQKYSLEHETSTAGVIIEALDAFLSGRASNN